VIGCGGALDILSGTLKRAPQFMIDNNLEWFFRLYKEPWRFRRQLFLPVFVVRLWFVALLQKFRASP
jgi:N-acetylglucosaminyldiphosphoundecaprenol N-acetyl-beta-D-mannosaminyltransferase